MRWTLQRGAVIAAGTGGSARTVEEYSVENLGALAFQLSETEMKQLDAMSPQP